MGSEDSSPEFTATPEAFYTPNGIQCVWRDSNRFAGRLRQLEMLNSVIGTLSSRLWVTDVSRIDYNDVRKDAMEYVDPFKRNDNGLHTWEMLANDELFKDPTSIDNAFFRFENYFQFNGGKSPQEMQKDFLAFMDIFIKLRAKLISTCLTECQPVS